MMLNILEACPAFAAEGSGASTSTQGYGGTRHNSADALHILIEAKKLAYADMQRHVADPAFSTVPVGPMLSKEYARARASLIDPKKAQASVVGSAELAGSVMFSGKGGGDTTYLSVVDRDGNMVSLIQSNFESFGSGVVAEGTGFPLQNRGALFTLDRTHPNVLAPRKRPLHTIIPAFMSNGSSRIAFGIMGGWNQSQAHAQFVSNVVDHTMNIQAALEAARFTKLSFEGTDVAIERRIPHDVQRDLAARGHELQAQGDFCSYMGGGQAVMRTDGINYGASDPRKDGAAIPEPISNCNLKSKI
jgi:gamma-glutamyltranspeptidase/glutathione hydrolase